MTKPNFEEFRYSGIGLDGAQIDEANVRRSAESRTRVDAISDDGQRLGVFSVTPSNLAYPEIIVRSTAFSDDNGRPEGALFDAYLAEATQRRVMAVNTPGVDYFIHDDTTRRLGRLTPDQHEELKIYGSFRKVGEASMRAVHNASLINGEEHPSFIISASSMGVAVGAGMIREALDKNMELSGVVLAEPVNHMKRPLGKLGLQFMMTNATAPGYLEMNPDPIRDTGESMGFWLRRVVAGRLANVAYAGALSAGTFRTDLGPIDGLADMKTPLYATRGTASRLSSSADGRDFSELIEYLHPIDSLQYDLFDGHDHPYTMTLQSVIDGVARVTEQ